MRVLAITGDKSFKPGHPRYDLQASAVELVALYWGRGALWPRLPAGHFDVVSAQDPFWRGLFAWVAARRLHARFNVQVHADMDGQSFVKHVLAQIVLGHADTVRVVSQKIKARVERMRTAARVSVLPVFVDIERFRAIVREPEKGTILWVGRLEDEKDPLRAVSILRQLPGARLIFLGSGSLEGKVRRASAGLPVEFAPWQDPAPFLARADVVLCTSRYESWGASIVEALAAGVPVVAPDVGVAQEAGAVVAVREKLAEKVAALLSSGARATLTMSLPNKEEWMRQWRESL